MFSQVNCLLAHFFIYLLFIYVFIHLVIFKLRELRGAVKCPAESCKCLYNTIELYSIISIPQRTRYLSILSSSLCDVDATGRLLTRLLTRLLIQSITYR